MQKAILKAVETKQTPHFNSSSYSTTIRIQVFNCINPNFSHLATTSTTSTTFTTLTMSLTAPPAAIYPDILTAFTAIQAHAKANGYAPLSTLYIVHSGLSGLQNGHQDLYEPGTQREMAYMRGLSSIYQNRFL
jgi:hypothetical protein